MRRVFLVLALAGCADGPRPETVLDGLVIVAAALEPVEPAVGEPFVAAVTVADPGGDAVLAGWTCGVDCVRSQAPIAGSAPVPLALVADAPGVAWFLACAPGVCDPAALGEQVLRDPLTWMADQPLEGVFLASRTLSGAPSDPPAENPVITVAPDAETLKGRDPAETFPLRFAVPGAETAYGRATSGGFAAAQVDVASDGEVTLDWYPPEQGERATVHVVFQTAAGGVAVWTAEVEP